MTLTPYNVVLVGCNGRFGGALARMFLAHSNIKLTGIDLHEKPRMAELSSNYVRGSIADPDHATLTAARRADWLLLCVPEEEVVRGIPKLLPELRPDSCAIDIASVKTRIACTVEATPCSCGYLSIHPMYSPDREAPDGAVIISSLKENEATKAFERLVRTWRVNVLRMSACEHDRLTAFVQVGPHVLLLAYGRALVSSGFEPCVVGTVSTPLLRRLLELLGRITEGSRCTYQSIQFHNPYARDARQQLLESLGSFDSISNEKDGYAFDEAIATIADFLRRSR